MSQALDLSQCDGLPVRASGPWIKKKHYYLNEYAKIFTIGMGKKWKNLTYLDLYAGPGRCSIKEAQEELDGSPLMMLSHPFTQYIFVEKDKRLMDALQQRCQNSPRRTDITFINDDCHASITQIVKAIPDGSLTLAFIDPTDINIPLSTVQELSQTSHGVDLLINFQVGIDLKRNLSLYKLQGERSKLAALLGPDVDLDQLENSQDVVKKYKQIIAGLGYATVEFADIPVHNRKRATMYFLFFASRNKIGLKFWNEIRRKDHLGQKELF